MKIEASTSLNKDEIEKLKKEAAEHATEDQKKRELIDAKNQAESLVYAAEKGLKDAGDKVPADVKEDVNAKIAKIKEIQEGSDAAAITAAANELSTSLQKIGESLYNKKDDTQPSNNK